MQEHPIPRQITTFEFKLIGELTIKQFGYLAFAAAATVILFFLVPKIMYLNLLAAALPALLGTGFAFVPINDRPMDIWLKNLFKRLMSPTQYFYRKHNAPPKILLGVQLPPREVLLQHIKAQQSLNEYLQKKPKTDSREEAALIDQGLDAKKRSIQALMLGGVAAIPAVNLAPSQAASVPVQNYSALSTPAPNEMYHSVPLPPTPPPQATVTPPSPEPPAVSSSAVFEGMVTTQNGLPLPGIMVYIKQGAETVRLFRSDNSGRFRNNLSLPPGEYFLEAEDPQKRYNFARMIINGQEPNVSVVAQT